MNNNMQQIFSNDSMNIADKIEYLSSSKNGSTYYIDRFPLTSDNFDKFDQLNILYQEVINGKAEKNIFLDIELKYRNVMNKLWLYNDMFVTFSGFSKEYAPLSKIVDKEYQKYLDIFENKNCKEKVFEITDKCELEFWVQLALRDATDAIFYLKNYQAIIVPNYDCVFNVYLDTNKYYPVIKDIATSEGLFLRQ